MPRLIITSTLYCDATPSANKPTGTPQALQIDSFVSALIEKEIAELEDEEEKSVYLEDLGLEAPGVDRLNQAIYKKTSSRVNSVKADDFCRKIYHIRKM